MSRVGPKASKGRRSNLPFLKTLALMAVVTITMKPQWLSESSFASRITFEQGFEGFLMESLTLNENVTPRRESQNATNSSAEIKQEYREDDFSVHNDTANMQRTENLTNAGDRSSAGQWHEVRGEDIPVAMEVADIDKIFEENNANISFCVEWKYKEADEWWSHHVDYMVFHEDDTHYCFQKIMNEKKRALFLKLYENQYHGNCSNMVSQPMIGSGWGASMSVVLNGLIEGMQSGRPVQTEIRPWPYAMGNPKKDIPPVCDSKDMYCFFLPTSNCPRKQGYTGGTGYIRGEELCCQGEYPWYLEFASRPQSWLRKRVYDFVKHQMASMSNFRTPCTIFHVRRADVTMDSNNRGFRAISEYLHATDKTEENVLLLTDDHNAIGEAKHEFPDAKNWMYLNRTRHRGSEGGWQPFNPSGDLAHEMAVIMGTFHIAEKCSSIIHTPGGFSSFLYGSTLKRHTKSWAVQLPDLKGEHVKASVNVSKAYD